MVKVNIQGVKPLTETQCQLNNVKPRAKPGDPVVALDRDGEVHYLIVGVNGVVRHPVFDEMYLFRGLERSSK